MKILNKNIDSYSNDAVYIGRGSKWGNPFKIGPDGTRVDVINKYENWLKTQSELIDSIDELIDRNLLCFCKPKACHGDVLVKVLTMSKYDRQLWAAGSYDRHNFFESE